MKPGLKKEDQQTITANGITRTVKEWSLVPRVSTDENGYTKVTYLRQTTIHSRRRRKLEGGCNLTWEQIVGEEPLPGKKKKPEKVTPKVNKKFNGHKSTKWPFSGSRLMLDFARRTLV